ncbi:MAG: helix-turn-helix domain-containing protein [Victivallaceae bacterium]|nr:helix-turn-helix domain-containing protein [Victivallaceae bacterium]
MKQNDKSLAPALERGLEIIEYIGRADNPVSFTELVTATAIPKATLSRLLKVLLSTGYLENSPNGYQPGAKCNILGQCAVVIDLLILHGKTAVKAVCVATECTCLLFYWNGEFTQVVSKAMHPESIAMQPEGNISADFIYPPWGWLFLDDLETSPVIKALHQEFMDSPRYRQRINYYHENGFTLDTATPHVVRLGAPIKNRTGKIVGALGLGINFPVNNHNEYKKLGKILKAEANKLSKKVY